MSDDAGDNIALVNRAKAGDASAFAALIARHERVCLAIAYARLHDAHAAGDVVQEAFLKAWQSLKTLGNPASFAGWLSQIVRNLATDTQRSKARREAESADVVADVPAGRGSDPAAAVADAEAAAAVDGALAGLDPLTREIVTLRYFDGLASKEIAPAVGLSPAAVDMRLSRARQHLKTVLEKTLDRTNLTEIPPHPLAAAGTAR